MKKVKIIGSIFVILMIIVLVIGVVLFQKYKNGLKPVNLGKECGKLIEVKIPEGYGVSGIANLLEKNNVIRDAMVFKIYAKLNNVNNLQAGLYVFDNSIEDVEDIVKKIQEGKIKDESVKLTFVEGKRITDYAKLIAENTNNTEDDVYSLLEDETYIDSLIEKYWFITDDITDENIYYPLEGYLLPDTYIFENSNVSVETIFNVILNYTDKYLTEYKEYIENSDYSIHEILTLASIVEQEGKTMEARSEIAGVFINRLESGMKLGSDVTTYYAFQLNMADGDLTKKQLNTENPYNTRGPNMEGKLPVGPICNSSKSSLDAALNPKDTDAYYFVADKNGQVYFTKNYSEHNKIIQELKNNDLWYVYE